MTNRTTARRGRSFRVVLLVLGAFFVVCSVMSRFYAYPRLAQAPKVQDTVAVLEAPGSTILDLGSLKEIETDLSTTVRTVGDVAAADAEGGTVIVWTTTTSTTSSDGVARTQRVEREPFDARTAEAVDCCSASVSVLQGVVDPVTRRGLLVRFPSDTRKRTYGFWDPTLGRALPMQFRGATTIRGLPVYRFEQTIPATETGMQELPLRLLGFTGAQTVDAHQMYANTRTVWVEPRTGAIIDRSEAVDETLDYRGESRLTVTKAVSTYDAATIKNNVAVYRSQAKRLDLLRSTLPPVSFALGLGALLGGIVPSLRRRMRAV